MMAAGLDGWERDASAPHRRRTTMPLISVTYSSVRKAPSLKADIASAVSDLTARILRKDPKVTAVIVKSVDAADWFAGGKSLADQSLASFWAMFMSARGPTPRTIRPTILPHCSSAWANCWDRCTRK